MKRIDPLLTEVETSKVVSKAVQTLRNDRHNRRGIPYIRIGRSIRYSLIDIEEYINKNRIRFDEREVENVENS